MAVAGPGHVFLACGEASGDRYGAALARALLARDPSLRITALGGPLLEEAGVEIVRGTEDLAVMGFAEVIQRLPVLWEARRSLGRHLESAGVDLFIPIDFPGFNGRLADDAQRAGVPVFWLIAPQLWAWGGWRVGGFRRRIDCLGTALPFEEEFFSARGFDVFPLGHPLMEDYGDGALFEAQVAAREGRLRDSRQPITVGILPGSRRQELDHLLPVLNVATQVLRSLGPGREFRVVASAAPGVDPAELTRALGADTTVSQEPLPDLLPQLDLAVVCSGTASLEVALAGVPHEIIYRTGAFNYWVARRLVRTAYIGLANLILERRWVTERVQDEVAPVPVAQGLLRWLNRAGVRNSFYGEARQLRARCGKAGVWERAASHALSLLKRGDS